MLRILSSINPMDTLDSSYQLFLRTSLPAELFDETAVSSIDQWPFYTRSKVSRASETTVENRWRLAEYCCPLFENRV